MNDKSIESARWELDKIFFETGVMEQTFSDLVDGDIVEAHLLGVWTECAFEVTKEVFPDGHFPTSLHEGVVPVHAAT